MTDQAGGVTEFRIGSVLGRGFSILLKNIVPFWSLAIFVSSPPTIYTLLSGARNAVETDVIVESSAMGGFMAIVGILLA
jgi:hypothetical protein